MTALSRRALLGSAVAASVPALLEARAEGSDPILAAIQAAHAAAARHTETCEALHHDASEAADRTCNAAADHAAATVEALQRIRPSTRGGLAALVAFYADQVDPRDEAADYLRHILSALQPPPAPS